MKKLNKRNPFRKGTTVKEFVSYLTTKLDSLGYDERVNACEDTEENFIEEFALSKGLDLKELYNFMARNGCNCPCTVINRILDTLSEDTIIETAIAEMANEETLKALEG